MEGKDEGGDWLIGSHQWRLEQDGVCQLLLKAQVQSGWWYVVTKASLAIGVTVLVAHSSCLHLYHAWLRSL